MAGSLMGSSIDENHRGIVAASEFSRWLVDFARFVHYPSSRSPFPELLLPIANRELAQNPTHFKGTWLSTSSSTASLQMVKEVDVSDVILSVELDGKVLEEHYISKLTFSWPQMSCVSGFPPRGSRVIFVSYKDSENKIQKFAVRFSTCDVAETFVEALKEKLKGVEESAIQNGDTRSEITSQSDYIPSNVIVPRATEEDPNLVKTPQSYTPEMLPKLEYESGQPLCQPQSTLSQIPNATFIDLPPSFTTLLSGCFPPTTLDCNSMKPSLDAGQTTLKQDPDLKSQIMKYMEDSAFQEMMVKVERIMDEIGGDWIQ